MRTPWSFVSLQLPVKLPLESKPIDLRYACQKSPVKEPSDSRKRPTNRCIPQRPPSRGVFGADCCRRAYSGPPQVN